MRAGVGPKALMDHPVHGHGRLKPAGRQGMGKGKKRAKRLMRAKYLRTRALSAGVLGPDH
jgi:hypothetical protein